MFIQNSWHRWWNCERNAYSIITQNVWISEQCQRHWMIQNHNQVRAVKSFYLFTENRTYEKRKNAFQWIFDKHTWCKTRMPIQRTIFDSVKKLKMMIRNNEEFLENWSTFNEKKLLRPSYSYSNILHVNIDKCIISVAFSIISFIIQYSSPK